MVSLEVIKEPTYDEAVDEDGENEDDVPADEIEDSDESIAPETGIGPEVLVVTDGGMGKRSFVSNYRKTKRGARGVVNIRLREGEKVLAVLQIVDDDEILITTERGQLTRIPVAEIRRIGRVGKGVKIMNLRDGDHITGVAKFVKVEGEKDPFAEAEGGNAEAASPAPESSAPVAGETAEASESGAPAEE